MGRGLEEFVIEMSRGQGDRRGRTDGREAVGEDPAAVSELGVLVVGPGLVVLHHQVHKAQADLRAPAPL